MIKFNAIMNKSSQSSSILILKTIMNKSSISQSLSILILKQSTRKKINYRKLHVSSQKIE